MLQVLCPPAILPARQQAAKTNSLAILSLNRTNRAHKEVRLFLKREDPMKLWHKLFISLTVLLPLAASGQILVDCSGANPKAFPSINAALPSAGVGSTILVTGTCNENVTLENLNNVSLGAWFGQTANINGEILISDSKLIYLYGLNFSNAQFDGIAVVHSTSVTIDSCTSSGNGQVGLAARYLSDVVVLTAGAFNNNVGHGMFIDGNSAVLLIPFGGPLEIRGNGANGVNLGIGAFQTWGNTIIDDNGGWGIQSTGGGRTQVGAVFGPNTIQGNTAGGASLTEDSEASFWNIEGFQSAIQGNGPVGISVGLGSQVTLFEGDNVSDHTSAGVEVYANSQANIFGANSIRGNGNSSDSRSAGIRVDGNSEALIRGGNVSQNGGPGILALVNSSADFAGVTFSGNAGGIINCDSSATMISDLAPPNSTPPGIRCKTPHGLGNRRMNLAPPKTQDITRYKALQARYKKIATRR